MRTIYALLALAVGFVAIPAHGVCGGDCDGNGAVGINELIIGVSITLSATDLGACPAFDLNASGDVLINELVAAVSYALSGCPCGHSPLESGEPLAEGCGGDPCVDEVCHAMNTCCEEAWSDTCVLAYDLCDGKRPIGICSPIVYSELQMLADEWPTLADHLHYATELGLTFQRADLCEPTLMTPRRRVAAFFRDSTDSEVILSHDLGEGGFFYGSSFVKAFAGGYEIFRRGVGFRVTYSGSNVGFEVVQLSPGGSPSFGGEHGDSLALERTADTGSAIQSPLVSANAKCAALGAVYWPCLIGEERIPSVPGTPTGFGIGLLCSQLKRSCISFGRLCDSIASVCGEVEKGGPCKRLLDNVDRSCYDDDLCPPEGICQGVFLCASIPCKDPHACTVDTCENGKCRFTLKVCDDGLQCNQASGVCGDTCDPESCAGSEDERYCYVRRCESGRCIRHFEPSAEYRKCEPLQVCGGARFDCRSDKCVLLAGGRTTPGCDPRTCREEVPPDQRSCKQGVCVPFTLLGEATFGETTCYTCNFTENPKRFSLEGAPQCQPATPSVSPTLTATFTSSPSATATPTKTSSATPTGVVRLAFDPPLYSIGDVRGSFDQCCADGTYPFAGHPCEGCGPSSASFCSFPLVFVRHADASVTVSRGDGSVLTSGDFPGIQGVNLNAERGSCITVEVLVSGGGYFAAADCWTDGRDAFRLVARVEVSGAEYSSHAFYGREWYTPEAWRVCVP